MKEKKCPVYGLQAACLLNVAVAVLLCYSPKKGGRMNTIRNGISKSASLECVRF